MRSKSVALLFSERRMPHGNDCDTFPAVDARTGHVLYVLCMLFLAMHGMSEDYWYAACAHLNSDARRCRYDSILWCAVILGCVVIVVTYGMVCLGDVDVCCIQTQMFESTVCGNICW
jgi:hypothetical protein